MEVIIRTGDSMFYLSKLFMVPLNLIMDSNPAVDPTNMEIGGKIKIPGYTAIPHQIKSGDSFWKLAYSINMESDAIQLLNPHKDPEKLQIGDTIYLPERMVQSITSKTSACDYKSLVKVLNNFKKMYPFISVDTIGNSVLGHDIQEIRIGKGGKKVHMNASFHANEWITTMVLLHVVNNYLLSITNGTLMGGFQTLDLYNNVELSIVPMVNPDGVELVLNGPPLTVEKDVMAINNGDNDFVHWKANIRGIDLNNQFPANWDICKKNKQPKVPAPRDFPGDFPLSEPEAVAMAELAHKNEFDCIVAFHTQGEEFYWGYEGYEPPQSEKIAKEFERVSGYRSVQYVESHAGYKDWFIQEFKRPGFTLELGRGINPLPLSQFPEILKRAERIFLAALYSS